MENFFGRLIARFSPRTHRVVTTLIHAAEQSDDGLMAKVIGYEQEVRELRAEVDELRQDNLRIAELYDLVFEQLRAEREPDRDP
ncbi:MAG: hypothetical protein QM607_06790 [Microbacterium sp.]